MATIIEKDTSGILQAKSTESEVERTRTFKKWETGEIKNEKPVFRIGGGICPIHYRSDVLDEKSDWLEIDLDIVEGSGSWDYEIEQNGYQVNV